MLHLIIFTTHPSVNYFHSVYVLIFPESTTQSLYCPLVGLSQTASHDTLLYSNKELPASHISNADFHSGGTGSLTTM